MGPTANLVAQASRSSGDRLVTHISTLRPAYQAPRLVSLVPGAGVRAGGGISRPGGDIPPKTAMSAPVADYGPLG